MFAARIVDSTYRGFLTVNSRVFPSAVGGGFGSAERHKDAPPVFKNFPPTPGAIACLKQCCLLLCLRQSYTDFHLGRPGRPAYAYQSGVPFSSTAAPWSGHFIPNVSDFQQVFGPIGLRALRALRELLRGMLLPVGRCADWGDDAHVIATPDK